MQDKVVALGFFDGVHLGHGALLSRATEIARERGAVSAALLFDRHPSHIVSKNPIPLINTTKERELLMKRIYGIDKTLPITFDAECAALPWDEFAKRILIDSLGATHLIAGFDFRFGHRGEGNGEKLRALCAKLGIGCDIIERVTLSGKTVSSSLIRELISRGEIEEANRFLGHNHFMFSPVEHGAALGRTLGIPTINQRFEKNLCLPRFGVYVTCVHICDKIYRSVTNIGLRPTVGENSEPRAETYILDYSGDLYAQNVAVEFTHMLRDEMKFESLDALKNQIQNDIEKAKKSYCPPPPGKAVLP